MSKSTAQLIQHFRQQFLQSRGVRSNMPGCSSTLTHFNNAGQSPLCRPSSEVLDLWNMRLAEEGAHGYPDFDQAANLARTHIARFMGCSVSEIAFFQGTAASISQIAFGVELHPGDEILIWDQEYPSNFYPWMIAARRSGARLVVLKSDPDLSTPISTIERAITDKTKVIASSWVQFKSGAMCDLKTLSALARSKNIFTAIDVIQGAGCLPFNFTELGLDAVSGGSHKWFAAGHGAGFLCLREEHLERIFPIMVGAGTFGGSERPVDLDAKPRSGAARYEPGGKAISQIISLGAAADLFTQTGIENIAQEIETSSLALGQSLEERGYQVNWPQGNYRRGSIVNFSPRPSSRFKTLTEIGEALKFAGISFATREPGIRLSPHAFNTKEDIESVLVALS